MTSMIFTRSILPVLGAMFIEGASIPFPGIVIILAFGSTMRPNFKETMIIAFFMAIIYTTATFIPYAIGRKYGVKVLSIFNKRKKVKSSIEKAKKIVNKYGIVTIAISRFFGWGNKISYIAGISKIRYIPYSILTFSGIYIWSITMLNLGKIFSGDTNILLDLIGKYTIYLYVISTVAIVAYILIALLRYKNKSNA